MKLSQFTIVAVLVVSSCGKPKDETGPKAEATAQAKPPEQVKPSEPVFPKAYEQVFTDEGKAVLPTSDRGFIVAASTDSKGAGALDVWLLKLDKKGSVEWEKTYGGAETEEPEAIIQSKDGGFVVAATRSYLSKDAKTDGWVFKADKDGNLLWDKVLGGENYDYLEDAAGTADGAFVIAGATASKGAGSLDGWVVKMSGIGEVEWEASFGEEGADGFKSIEATKDGGFFAAGRKGQKNTQYQDGWVVRLGGDGKKVWDKVLEGRFYDSVDAVRPTSDGGAIAVGDTQSNDEQLSNMWLVKLNGDGAPEWEKQHGGPNDDRAVSVAESKDGGYVLCGKTSRKLSEEEAIVTTGPWGASKDYLSSDLTVIKLGKDGAILWEKTYGDKREGCEELAIASDGYVLTGWTASKAKRGIDVWVVSLDSKGETLWEMVFGS